jgi:lipopolysaccharide transport system permease protein
MKPAYRSVFRELLRRELGERYRGSFLGVFWHLLLPLMQLAVLSWVFSHVLQARTQFENISYAAFLALGLWPWNLFANAVNNGVIALTSNSALIGKVALPHHLLVNAKVTSSVLLDLAGFFVILMALVLLGTPLKISGIPVVLLCLTVLCIFAIGFANIVAVLNVFMRDVGAAMSQILGLLFFLTPILYDTGQLPNTFQQWLLLNPFAAPVMAIRHAFLGLPVDWFQLGVSALVALIVAYLGHALLKRARPHLEDYL